MYDEQHIKKSACLKSACLKLRSVDKVLFSYVSGISVVPTLRPSKIS